MNVIRKIFEGKFDEEVHSDFIKFSRGEFKDKYLVNAKKKKEGWVIKTGAEFANYLVRSGLEKAKDKLAITGVIVSTFNIRDGMGGSVFKPNEEIKQFMGIKQLKVDSEIDKTKVLEVMNKYPRAFFALSFVLPDYELKIKAKAPKSAKPSTNTEKEVKPEFCSLKTTDENFIKELFFDFPKFDEIELNHLLKVEDIVYPAGVDKMKPEEVREKSKRKGVVVRRIIIDGKTEKREAKFEA